MSYQSIHKSILTRTKNLYRKQVLSALKAQINAFIAEYRRTGVYQPVELPTDQIKAVLLSIAYTAGVPMGRVINRDLQKKLNRKSAFLLMEKKGEDEEEERWKRIIKYYYEQYLFDKVVVEIANTTLKQIEAVIMKGLQEGLGIEEMVKLLKDSPITAARAELIIRTETTRAANVGAMVAAADSGLALRKEWVSTQDDRTRRIPRDNYDHLHMDGIQVDFSEPFIVPSLKTLDAMQFPGDPAGSAGNVCNCRCYMVFNPYTDGMGQPISVQNNSPINSNVFLSLSKKIDEINLTP